MFNAEHFDIGLINRVIKFHYSSTYVISIHQRHRRTDGQTDGRHDGMTAPLLY